MLILDISAATIIYGVRVRRGLAGDVIIEGNPAGTIYLNQEQITFARASGIPDLGARLPGVLRPTPPRRT